MRRAFTLIELLVVIAIIALMMGILLPALGLARRHAQSVASSANLRSLTQVMIVYTGDNKEAFLNPFHSGCMSESSKCGDIDCTDAAIDCHTCQNWDFAVSSDERLTTEYFAYYWYSFLSGMDQQPRIREEQMAPADAHIRGLWSEYRDSSAFSGLNALWPSSYLYSPTFWCDPSRYDPGQTDRASNIFGAEIKTVFHSGVSFPSSKVLMFERMDFEQRERVVVERNESHRQGRPPSWNNIGATTAVAVVDGSVEEAPMRTLYAELGDSGSEIAPVGTARMADNPPILLSKQSKPQALGGSEGTDGEYPLFFWATQWGSEGRDLPR